MLLDLTHTTNERQLENQGVTKSEGKTDTEWDAAVRQSHPPKHARWGLCPIVCLYWLTVVKHTHTYSTSLSLNTHVALWKLHLHNISKITQLNTSVSLNQAHISSIGWITELGKQQRASLRVSKWLWSILGTYHYPTSLTHSWTTQHVHLTDLKRWNTSRWRLKLKLCWDNDRWISTRC